MKIDPLGIIPLAPLHKLNWFEGFKRIKNVLSVAFVLVVIVASSFQYFQQMYRMGGTAKPGEEGFIAGEQKGFWPEGNAKGGEIIVYWGGGGISIFFSKAQESMKLMKSLKEWTALNFQKGTFSQS
jgi:hypothetical protein